MTRSSAGRPPITSRHHPVAVRVRKINRRPALARRLGVFLLDGVHLLEEALASPYLPESILVAPRLEETPAGPALLGEMKQRGWPILRVSDDLLAELAPTTTPQGVLGLFQRASPPSLPPAWPGPGAVALVLAGLQDPTNLGALARAARVFGCPTLVTLEETVDPFHPRATRASAGSLLHLTVVTDVAQPTLRAWVEAWRVRLVSLAPHGGRPIAAAPRMERPLALVLGSEGQGIGPEIEALCEECWSIPMAEGVDSLGVAAAGSIALYAVMCRGLWQGYGDSNPGLMAENHLS